MTRKRLLVGSWLLAGGATIQTVRERLGHASLRATERYLHSLAESDEAALVAFERVRRRPEGSGGYHGRSTAG